MIKQLNLIPLFAALIVSACNDSFSQENVKKQPDINASANPSNFEVKLKDKLPATCNVLNSDNISFCMPGDTLIYRYDSKKEDQKDLLSVIGDFCAQEKPIIITGNGLACTFRENRTYTADPVNRNAIIASNRAMAREYLTAVAKIPGIKQVAKGISLIQIESGDQNADIINDNSIVKLESKLLTLDLKIHSYMLNDTIEIKKLGENNPFSAILPNLRAGDCVRAYIDFETFPGLWKVSESSVGLPYIWEIKILSVDNSGSSANNNQENSK